MRSNDDAGGARRRRCCGAGAPHAAAPATSFTADPASSRLEFTGVQAGAEFKGVFHKFSAAVEFSPDALANAHFDVVIDMASEDSGDKDRDGTMRGADIFDVAHFPTAHYVTKSFAKTASGYTAHRLADAARRHQGRAHRVQVHPERGGRDVFPEPPQLKRLDFGVGRGDWKSTDWVADAVKVAFSLNLKPKILSAGAAVAPVESAHRQLARFLHRAQREARMHPRHVRQAGEMLAVQALEIGGIREHHAQQIIVLART